MNHMLVAELLAEDAMLKEIAQELHDATVSGDPAAVEKAETLQLKHSNMRNLILSEMSKTELALYELQRDHSPSTSVSATP
jgi:hypothetical protein